MNKFDIKYAEIISEGEIKKEKYAGRAIYKEEGNYYKLHLSMFPTTTYFLKKNKDDSFYTIYSKILAPEANKFARFANPVGVGLSDSDVSSHMRLNFDVLSSSLYMSFFPIMESVVAS